MDSTTSRWPSKTIFILAAIGSAAGLGNLWRFPHLAYDNGGAAFIIALIIANLIVGIPLLIGELGLGQKTRKAAPEAFASIKKHFAFIGWFGVGIMALIIAYYMAVMSWSLNYLVSAFSLGWGTDTGAYFFENVLQLSGGPGEVGGIVVPVLIGFIVSWVLVYLSVWKGVESVSSVVKWTATLPFAILAILVIRALSLDGAGAGLAAYLIPEWSALLSTKLWLAAFSQVFFSLSIALGVMVAYASFNKENTEIVTSALWIAGGNFLVSFLAGLAVFGTLGYMATQQGVAVSEVATAGPGLLFVTIPQAISLMPFAEVFGVLLFATVALLAIDSAFSLFEGVATASKNKYKELTHHKVTAWTAAVLVLAGLPFATGAGLYYLDILDHFVVSYGIVLVGILEALVLGWTAPGRAVKEYINENADWKLGWCWDAAIKFIIPVFLGILLIVNLVAELKTPYEGYPLWALIWIGIVPVVAVAIAALVMSRK